MDTEVTGNQNYDNHYANYCKDVHSAVLHFFKAYGRFTRYPLPPLIIVCLRKIGTAQSCLPQFLAIRVDTAAECKPDSVKTARRSRD